ncbi:hypothetical protein [uncultured Porphyromonas sp.]|uniref:hypothetical protein n=1 Tax=uncultured Porphyromonas sp. TaxID=159274 RepID=UPI0028063B9C|nr:hypothetical protein [uncultured Porphyromonas sp.]
MMLESLDKHDQGVPGADVTGAQAQQSELSERENLSNQSYLSNQSNQSAQSGVDVDGRTHRSAPTNRDPSGGGSGVPAGGGVRVPLIGAAGAGGQEVVGTQAGAGLPTKSMGVVDWAKVIDGYRQSQQAETQQSEPSELSGAPKSEQSERSEPSEVSESAVSEGAKGQSGFDTTDAQSERPYSGLPVAGTETQSEGAGSSQGSTAKSQPQDETGGGSVSLEPTDAVEVARERKARAVERVVEGLRDETFYNALMRGVEDPREVQRKREEYRRKGAAWRSMVSLADMVANAIDAYGADRNAYTLERGLGTARYDQMLARELSRLDSEYRLAEGLERDALGKAQDRKDRASAVELQEARAALADAMDERAVRDKAKAREEEKKYRADRDKVRDNQWEKEFKERQEDRKARRALQARRMNGGGSGRGGGRGGRGGSRGGGRSVFFDVWGKNSWNHELLVPEGNEKEFRESAIRYGRSNAGWLIKNNPVYVRTYAAQMGLPTKGVSTSDLLQRVKESGNMDDMYAGLATTSRGFLLSRSVAYGDGEALTRVMEETVSPVRGAVVRGISDGNRKRIAGLMAKSIKVDADACDVSVGEMYQVYESEMYAGVGDNAVGRVDKFMDEVANCFDK